MQVILADFLVLKPEGIYCRYGNFYLDPQSPVKTAVISHAHGDHAKPGNQLVYCTAPTAAIMKWRYQNRVTELFEIYPYHHSFFIQDIKVTFISAGHILGSAQILLEYQGVKYLYTGDYKIQSDPTCDPITFVEADVLITESTFANPITKHPNVVDEILKLKESPYSVLLGAYALGKAQRINQLINEHCPERTVLVHRSIFSIHKIYEEFGINNLIYQPYERRLMKSTNKGYVYLVPPLAFNSYDRGKTLIRAFASGWKHLQQGNTISLYISDHVDWEEILFTVQQVKPKEIWTLHGDGRYLRDYYEGQIPVKVLNEALI
jgi:putative mRNA 3-end processing factor